MIAFWVGIDVSKRKLDVAFLDERGKVKSRVFSNDAPGHDQLDRWLVERGAAAQTAHVCMEATGPYSEAPAMALADAGWRISVVNPLSVKRFAESQLVRNKTDRADAALLARYCAKMQPDAWSPPSSEQRQLRALVDRLQALKDMHQQERNRLEGSAEMAQSINDHLHWLEERIKALERDIEDHIDKHPLLKRDAQLITTIPGLGSTTAAKLLAYIGDVRRFGSAKALSAFIGVTPRQRESGSSVRGRSSISRLGHARVRQALFMPAMVALRYNPAIKLFGERLRANGLAKKAVIAASMHKLVHEIYGVLRSGLAFDPARAASRVDLQVSI